MDDETKWKNAYAFLTMDGEFPDEYVNLADATLLVDFLGFLADESLLREGKEIGVENDRSASKVGV